MYEFDAAVNGALVIKGKNNITKRQLSKCIKKKIDHFIHVESETDICKTDWTLDGKGVSHEINLRSLAFQSRQIKLFLSWCESFCTCPM